MTRRSAGGQATRLLVLVLGAALGGSLPAGAGRASPLPKYHGWPVYGGGPDGIRYSALDQINRQNVSRLETAWKYDSGEEGGLQSNPIVVDGVLYTTTPRHKVVATGQDRGDDHGSPSPLALKYRFTGYRKLLDPDGYPAIAPPWGTLTAIDLDTGEQAWQVPLGEYPALAQSGLTDTGSENYGGPVVTAGGLVFIAATSFDRKFRAFDKATGRLLWETTLPFSRIGTPATYEVAGRQFVVVPAGGGKDGGASGGTYVAFALPQAAGAP